jgi:hypothetical protein
MLSYDAEMANTRARAIYRTPIMTEAEVVSWSRGGNSRIITSNSTNGAASTNAVASKPQIGGMPCTS